MNWPYIALFLLLIGQCSETKRHLKYCLLDNVLNCYMETITRFTQQTNGTGVATTDQEYEEYCHAVGDVAQYCFKKYIDRCGAGTGRVLYQFFIKKMEENIHSYCKQEPGSVREKFLRNADCIIHKVKLTSEYRNTCIRDLHQESETPIDKKNALISYTQNNCCAMNRWVACIQDMIADKCGQEASDVFPNLIVSLDVVVFHLCQKLPQFNPRNEDTVCNKTLERTIEEPKGFQSSSLLSKSFSNFCPNVGFGISNFL